MESRSFILNKHTNHIFLKLLNLIKNEIIQHTKRIVPAKQLTTHISRNSQYRFVSPLHLKNNTNATSIERVNY